MASAHGGSMHRDRIETVRKQIGIRRKLGGVEKTHDTSGMSAPFVTNLKKIRYGSKIPSRFRHHRSAPRALRNFGGRRLSGRPWDGNIVRREQIRTDRNPVGRRREVHNVAADVGKVKPRQGAEFGFGRFSQNRPKLGFGGGTVAAFDLR